MGTTESSTEVPPLPLLCLGFVLDRQTDGRLAIQDWVAFMSQPYWVEIKVEVELRLILRLS